MSEYIGNAGDRITIEVTYKKRFEYTTYYTYYGESHNIFKMEDADGNVLVWNTTGWLQDKKFVAENGMCHPIWEGSKVLLTATVKEHSEYKGTKQTVVSRPKFTLIELAKSPDEIAREREEAAKQKRDDQLASIAEGDIIREMPYRQYKAHYADCETVIDSYNAKYSTVQVIIRNGRLKPNGTRDEHYSGYEFTANDGSKVCYRAISEETARKRLMKEHPDDREWECTEIFDYRVHRIW